MSNRIAAVGVAIGAALSAGAAMAHAGHGVGSPHTHVQPLLPDYVAHMLAGWPLIAVAGVIVAGTAAALRGLRTGKAARSR